MEFDVEPPPLGGAREHLAAACRKPEKKNKSGREELRH